MGGGFTVSLVFRFGPNLKLKFWPKPKLNNNCHLDMCHLGMNHTSICIQDKQFLLHYYSDDDAQYYNKKPNKDMLMYSL